MTFKAEDTAEDTDHSHSEEESEEVHCYSLNSSYGHKIGILQSLSLLLNAGLMGYAHVGLSGVFLSNHPRIDQATSDNTISSTNGTTVAACSLEDQSLWQASGALLRPDHQAFCAVSYPGETHTGCFFAEDCNAQCFQGFFGYSEPCAACFAPLPQCNFFAGCQSVCSGKDDMDRDACEVCTKDCDDVFYNCSGLPRLDWKLLTLPPNATAAVALTTSENIYTSSIYLQEEPQGICEIQQENVDYQAVDEYHVVYEIKFFESVEAAWTGDARLLAVIVVVFSGIWPYAKNLLLMLAWYLPLTEKRRSSLLLWLRRLGKYTLVDIYLIIILLVSILVELSVNDGTVPLILKGEPRGAIIAFLFATLWEFVHIEWMTHCHHAEIHLSQRDRAQRSVDNVLDALEFRKGTEPQSVTCKKPLFFKSLVWLFLAASIYLFVAGTTSENIRFTSLVAEETEGCVRSYNLYSLGTALVSDLALHQNSATGMVWILLLAFFILLVVLPLFVHLVQVLVFLLKVKNRRLCLLADAIWTFASVDVYLLALFVVQYKFSELIQTLAGEDGSDFFTIKSELGPGFFILIAYSVLAGSFQWLFNCAVAGYHPMDVLDRCIPVSTYMCGCFFEEEREEQTPRQSKGDTTHVTEHLNSTDVNDSA